MSHSLRPHGVHHTRLPCSSLSPGVCSNSCPLSRWCHPTTSSSVTPLFSRPQSFPASESFPVSRLFASGGQSIGASASASVLPVSTQGGFPLELSGWVSLQSKGRSGVFSSTTVGKHRFSGAQPSLWYPSSEKRLFSSPWSGVQPVVWLALSICVLPFRETSALDQGESSLFAKLRKGFEHWNKTQIKMKGIVKGVAWGKLWECHPRTLMSVEY